MKNRFVQHNRICLVIAALLALLFSFGTCQADYLFEIPEDLVIFWVEENGSVSISYEMTIINRGQPLDYIDIGLPNDNYSLSDVEVTLDGVTVDSSRLSRANYQDSGLYHGVTIDNTSNPIASGSSTKVYVYVGSLSGIIYPTDSVSENPTVEYVGFQFSPNYFNRDFTRGMTDFTIRLVLPAGALDSDDMRYYTPKSWDGDDEPESWITENGNLVYEWQSLKANSYSEYVFGAAFPRGLLVSTDGLGSENSFSDDFSSSDFFSALCGCSPMLIIFIVIFFLFKRKKQAGKYKAGSYLPPTINTSGEGIKRGLTAVEAAVLLECELDRIVTMIIFSLSKKGIIEIIAQDPLRVRFSNPLPEGLHEYEKDMIDALNADEKNKRTDIMRKLFKKLIKTVNNKMKGFDSEETRAYYKAIIEKAWQQVENADTPELKSKLLDQHFGWAMLEENIEEKTTQSFGGNPVFVPSWWWRMGPSWRTYRPIPSSIGTPVGGGGVSPSSINMPTLPGADFARSITDSFRDFGEQTVGNVKGFRSSLSAVTNPAPRSSDDRSSGSSRSGGHSCACACACASCACACAGGGR